AATTQDQLLFYSIYKHSCVMVSAFSETIEASRWSGRYISASNPPQRACKRYFPYASRGTIMDTKKLFGCIHVSDQNAPLLQMKQVKQVKQMKQVKQTANNVLKLTTMEVLSAILR